MLSIEKSGMGIKCTMAADIESVELFSHILADMLIYDRVRNETSLTLVARELLTNAVVYLKHGGAAGPVEFSLDVDPGSWHKITVSCGRVELSSIQPDPRGEGVCIGRRIEDPNYSIVGRLASRIDISEDGTRVTAFVSHDASSPDFPFSIETRTREIGTTVLT
jgi:two-component sensor histidine kinase